MRWYSVLVLFSWLYFINASSISVYKEDNTKRQYDDYAVYKLIFENVDQHKFLLEFVESHDGYNVWQDSKTELTLMVGPYVETQFRDVTNALNVNVELYIPNVQKLIDEEQIPSKSTKLSETSTFSWTRYYNLPDIENWLDEILSEYPNVTEGFIIGKSYEGRNIRGIKISYKANNPGIFIESNIHAREWITSATATWFINELLSSSDEKVRNLAENIDWYIVPVLNVDGFTYTHERDRMWRKTRQPSDISPCIGVDPNRNYNSHWMENNGASANPCSETYAGPYALSEPEIKAMNDYVGNIKQKLNIMIAFHSFSQVLLAPYGFTSTEYPDNIDDLLSVAKAYSDAVKQLPYGTNYTYGATSETMYPASGATNDWAYTEHDIKISYTIEFRDTGRYGFVLPPVQIVPNGEETLMGILALVERARELGYLQVKY